jgi:hypothetical protein
LTELPGSATGPWQPRHPREAPQLLASVKSRWWVAGGWALDLFVGSRSRPHKDLDIGILRRDAPTCIACARKTTPTFVTSFRG